MAVVRAGGVPAAQRAWWAPITTTAAAGGQVRGWLCPPCNDAKQASGAGLGIEAARRALLAHLAATGQTELRDRWRGDPDQHLVPFVQAGRLMPGRPWAFLLDDDGSVVGTRVVSRGEGLRVAPGPLERRWQRRVEAVGRA